jgi:EAL domain-containing protein (putative c-di-GMP-specific phosphodiesterase class I)
MHRKILNLLEKYEVPVEKVIIEITEEDVAKAGERFRTQMNDFIGSGFTIWVDDFGTGYSSLNVFTRFHFDLIKIDQSLVSRLDQDEGANKVLIKAIVETAHQLGIRTLCEGVETKEQFEFVKETSCDFTQGFYFFKPEPLDAIVLGSQGSVPDVHPE